MTDPRMTPTNDEPVTVEQSPCLTPGCRYSTEIKTHYAHSSYGNARVGVTALFPEWKGLKASTREHLKHVENILHRHMEAAVAEIGQYDLTIGGTIAKDWPKPHRLAALASAPAGDGVREALQLARDLIDSIEQSSGNVWWVNSGDPETAVCHVSDVLNRAIAASLPLLTDQSGEDILWHDAREIALKFALPGKYDAQGSHAVRKGKCDNQDYMAAIRYALSRPALARPRAAVGLEYNGGRCTYCDGTGEVHRADGEWLGECPDCKPERAAVGEPITPALHEGGRFREWQSVDLAQQCLAQAREQLDPEFSQFMTAVAERLAHPCVAAEQSREAIGRLIDPDAWHDTLPQDGCGAYWMGRRIKACEKADAILALQSPPAKVEGKA